MEMSNIAKSLENDARSVHKSGNCETKIALPITASWNRNRWFEIDGEGHAGNRGRPRDVPRLLADGRRSRRTSAEQRSRRQPFAQNAVCALTNRDQPSEPNSGMQRAFRGHPKIEK